MVNTTTDGGEDVSFAVKRRDAIASTKKIPNSSGLSEVCGLCEAKEMLYEAVVMPAKYPHLYQGTALIFI